ncbi:MAG TPA: helix-turn-helix domain-containing protein [Thermoplasmata archaeon]|jgi:sugar-specific transcriptional regulator TrmB|nr:helix-turn-helix domain-containing protein [Thermoplasmata archaeon]
MTDVRKRANVLLEEAAGASQEDIAATLRGLGLSGYASDAFCALVRLPHATAGDLVTRTGIPDSKIYYALGELADKGLVAVQAGKPKTYRAVSPKDAAARLGRILDEKYERERTAVTRVAALLEPLQSAAKTPSTDLAYVVKGLSNVVARAQAMVASARKEIVVLASDEGFLRKLEADLVKASARRVKVKLAVPDIPLPKELQKAAEVREIVCSCLVLVADGAQVLTVTRLADGSAYGITSTDETLVRLGLEYWDSPRCCVAC